MPQRPPVPSASPRSDLRGGAHASKGGGALDRDHLFARFKALIPPKVGVAVSGGGDSLALLHLLHDWGGASLYVATVDHGLRPESRAEAESVARTCATLGLSHDILRLDRLPPGNLMAAARQARFSALADWAQTRGLDAVALGHTRDDQAETLMFRLMRGAGLDGLSGMAARHHRLGVDWLRPLLDVGRQSLRHDLRARGQVWVDDPSNDNPTFDRVRIRQAMTALGLDPAALARSAKALGDAQEVVVHAAQDLVQGNLRVEAGDILLNQAIIEAPPELCRRIVAMAIRLIGGHGIGGRAKNMRPPKETDTDPRGPALDRFLATLAAGSGATLAGVRAVVEKPATDQGRPAACWRLGREYAAIGPPVAIEGGGTVWDRRFRVTGPDAEVRALGPEGLAALARQGENWRQAGLPYASALTQPGIWRGGRLMAAPTLAPHLAPAWQAQNTVTIARFCALLSSRSSFGRFLD